MFKMLRPYRKAIASAIVAGGAMYLKCDADDVMTKLEWLEVLFATLGGGGLTWLIPNTPLPAIEARSPRHEL